MKSLDKLVSGAKASEASEASESQEAAQDILDAIASKDAKALDLALQRHMACCEGEEEGEYKDDDSDEEA